MLNLSLQQRENYFYSELDHSNNNNTHYFYFVLVC
jgi:hypothetical protein